MCLFWHVCNSFVKGARNLEEGVTLSRYVERINWPQIELVVFAHDQKVGFGRLVFGYGVPQHVVLQGRHRLPLRKFIEEWRLLLLIQP